MKVVANNAGENVFGRSVKSWNKVLPNFRHGQQDGTIWVGVVNSSKTGLVLFTRSKNIDKFRLPTQEGVTLKLSTEEKYLVVIPDSKLSWKRNIGERIKKILMLSMPQQNFWEEM